MKTFSDYGIDVSGSGQQRALCPQCSPTRTKSSEKCLSVNVDEGTWTCHHCQWSGGLQNDQPIIRRVKKKVYDKPEYKNNGLDETVIKFFTGRGIPVDVLERNNVSGNVSGIRFPYFKDGEVINIKTRMKHKTFRLESKAQLIPYGLDDLNADETFWVEGEMDKLALEACGIKNCLAAPSAPSVKFLDGLDFSGVKRFVLAGDMDAPGRQLTEELARRFGKSRCWTVEWPEGCKDANDTLMKHGVDRVRMCLYNANEMRVDGIFKPSDFAVKLKTLHTNGITKGFNVGFASLKSHFSILPAQWTVITGSPSSGKSQFLDAVILNTIKLHGMKWGICSMENQPVEFHLMNMISMLEGKPFLEGYSTRLNETEMQSALDVLDAHISTILPSDDFTLDSILGLAEGLIRQKGIKGIVIDPWNELDHKIPRGESETQYISRSLGDIRRFARKHDVHIFVVAHPTKLNKMSNGKYPVATPYDISGSAHWYNKADNAISAYRPDIIDTYVEIHVQKIRFQAQTGRPGMAKMRYNLNSRRYEDDGPCCLNTKSDWDAFSDL